MIPPHLRFEHLKRVVRIERVLAERGWLERMRVRGKNLVGPCPIHGGDNPGAFVVHREKNLWYCFTGCAAGGDIVELVRRLDGASYRDLAHHLAALAGTPTAGPPPTPASSVQRPFRPFTRRLRLDAGAAFLRRKGIWPRTARSFDIGAYHGRGLLAGCLGVRLFDPGGRPLGYAGRRLGPEHAAVHGKWTMPRGMPRGSLLYAYHRVPTSGALVLVECPWGALRLHQLGIPAVALLGTSMSPVQEALLRRARRVVLLMDGDVAGRKAAHTVHQRLTGSCVVDLPDGFDPDDLSDHELAARVGHLA